MMGEGYKVFFEVKRGPEKTFDSFSLEGGCSEALDALNFSSTLLLFFLHKSILYINKNKTEQNKNGPS